MSIAVQFFLGWCAVCVLTMALLIVPQEIARARRHRRLIGWLLRDVDRLTAKTAEMQGFIDGQEEAYVEAIRIGDGWKASYLDARRELEQAPVDLAPWEDVR